MRGRVLALIVGTVSLLSAGTVAPGPVQAGRLTLERVVVVERHGVRAPTRTPEALSKYSLEPWPPWPVATAELTPHGGRDVGLMGAWLRADYARKGLWPAKGCPAPGVAYAWADGHDQRTRASGDALLAGAFPGCGLTADHGPEGAVDPLFDAVSAGVCPVDADAARQAVLSRAKDGLEAPYPGYLADLRTLWDILAPAKDRPACADSQDVCFATGRNTLDAKDGELQLKGPLGTASTLTESLFLEDAQGMDRPGWGWVDTPAKLEAIMRLHNVETDLMRRTPYLAGRNAALLAHAVADAVAGHTAFPRQGDAGAKLVLIAGHDTNLSNLAGVLGVDWSLQGQPDATPPDGALVFEVWRGEDGARFVTVALIYQTLDQLREETPLDADHQPSRVALPLPGCADGPEEACRLDQFEKRIEAAVPPTCWARR